MKGSLLGPGGEINGVFLAFFEDLEGRKIRKKIVARNNSTSNIIVIGGMFATLLGGLDFALSLFVDILLWELIG